MSVNRWVHGDIHFPLVRPQTRSRWNQCERVLSEHATAVVKRGGLPYFLTTDHNDHSGELFNPTGFKRLGGEDIDYIGVRLPTGWRVNPGDKARPQSVTVLAKKSVNGTIDNHNFYGAKVLVVFQDGTQARFWLVTANLGRGEPAAVFTTNVKRIKAAFTRDAAFGFQEIDEADQPQEHEELRTAMPFPTFRVAGWGTMNPIVSRNLLIKNARISVACSGLAKFTPDRLLVEGAYEFKLPKK